MRNLNYYASKGTETVEFQIDRSKDYPYPVTICSVNVDLLLCGIDVCPCADGDNYKLGDADKTAIFLFVQLRRNQTRSKENVKTMDGLHKSGLAETLDYLEPGDVVGEDMIEFFRNQLPPATDRSGLMQMGDPYSHVLGDDQRQHATYLTFSRAYRNLWEYKGICFRNETENRVFDADKVKRALKKLGHSI